MRILFSTHKDALESCAQSILRAFTIIWSKLFGIYLFVQLRLTNQTHTNKLTRSITEYQYLSFTCKAILQFYNM